MKCPRCGHEQSDDWLSCQKCHIIFSRWKPDAVAASRQSTATESAPSSAAAEVPGPPWPERMFADPPQGTTLFSGTEPAPPPARTVHWLVYLALLLPFAVALYLLLNPMGRAVDPGSHRDNKNHFAIRAPEGWLTMTKENFDVIVRQYGAQIPAKLLQTMNSQGLAVSFIRLSQAGEFAPSINVMIVKRAPPPINEKSKQEAAKAIASGFAAMFADYQQESVKIIEVDSIRSLEIVSTTSMTFQSSKAEGGTTLALRSRQVLVPGKNRAYILTFTSSKDAGEDSEAAFQGALGSFRVLKRPPRFSPVINGGLIGGLLGAIFFLLIGLLRSLGGGRER